MKLDTLPTEWIALNAKRIVILVLKHPVHNALKVITFQAVSANNVNLYANNVVVINVSLVLPYIIHKVKNAWPATLTVSLVIRLLVFNVLIDTILTVRIAENVNQIVLHVRRTLAYSATPDTMRMVRIAWIVKIIA